MSKTWGVSKDGVHTLWAGPCVTLGEVVLVTRECWPGRWTELSRGALYRQGMVGGVDTEPKVRGDHLDLPTLHQFTHEEARVPEGDHTAW